MDIHNRLQDMGYGVAAIVPSGEEAIRKTEELRPDLVLMDITLGKGIDGIEAANRINAKYNIPVIYLSSNIAEDRMEQIKATNPFGFIIKPFEDRDLRITIEMALYRRRMEEKLSRSEEKYRTILEISRRRILRLILPETSHFSMMHCANWQDCQEINCWE